MDPKIKSWGDGVLGEVAIISRRHCPIYSGNPLAAQRAAYSEIFRLILGRELAIGSPG